MFKYFFIILSGDRAENLQITYWEKRFAKRSKSDISTSNHSKNDFFSLVFLYFIFVRKI